jgi:hypothetical protein
MGIMRRIWLISLLLLQIGTRPGVAEDKPTSLSDARAAVEANMRTAEGKAYDDKLGADFTEKHLAAIRPCKKAGGDDLRSFWILAKLNGDGAVREVLLYPKTKVGECSREALLKDRFPPPPHPAYWVSIYMKPSK